LYCVDVHSISPGGKFVNTAAFRAPNQVLSQRKVESLCRGGHCPSGGFAAQNHIAAGETTWFSFGKSGNCSNFRRTTNGRPYK